MGRLASATLSVSMGKYGQIECHRLRRPHTLHDSCLCAALNMFGGCAGMRCAGNHVSRRHALIMPPAAMPAACQILLLIGEGRGGDAARATREEDWQTGVRDVRAREGMSGGRQGPLSIGIIWGIVCTAKYGRNIWHLSRGPYAIRSAAPVRLEQNHKATYTCTMVK